METEKKIQILDYIKRINGLLNFMRTLPGGNKVEQKEARETIRTSLEGIREVCGGQAPPKPRVIQIQDLSLAVLRDLYKCPFCGTDKYPKAKAEDFCKTPGCEGRVVMYYKIPTWSNGPRVQR